MQLITTRFQPRPTATHFPAFKKGLIVVATVSSGGAPPPANLSHALGNPDAAQ